MSHFLLLIFSTIAGAFALATANASPSALEEFLFQSQVKTDAIYVIKDGAIILERYGRGYDHNSRHLIWSASKSVESILVGMAVQQGKLSLTTPVCRYYPEVGNCALQIHHLLEWTSGLKWVEDYDSAQGSATASSILQMLYGPGSKDMAKFAATRGLGAVPGTSWNYSSGDSNLLMGILKKVYGPDYSGLPWKEIFEPLDIHSATWEADATGTYVGSSYLYLNARDLAQIGLLSLQKGQWNGKTLLPESWITYSTTANTVETPAQIAQEDLGGASWWVNRSATAPGVSSWPDAPADAFAAEGHWGQYLVVIPSLHAVAVRYGDDRDDKYFTMKEYMKRLTEFLQ